MRSCCYTSGSSSITPQRRVVILQTEVTFRWGEGTIHSGRTTMLSPILM